MRMLMYFVVAVLSIVSGKPYSESTYVNQTEVHVSDGLSIPRECREVYNRETCSAIFAEAIYINSSFRGFRHFFDHYCRKIAGFVPCLEPNKELYRVLIHCDFEVEISAWEQLLTFDEIWEMTLNFISTMNDIICSRKDEVVNLAECIVKNDYAVQHQMMTCMMSHITPFVHSIESLALEPSFYCATMYGAANCIVDGLSTICTDSSDLLDTVYDDIVVGVMGNAADCEEEPNPVQNFIRSVREKLRR